MAIPKIQAVLFDLDGTLIDTAPDLVYALNCMRVSRKLEVLPVAATRAYTSMGARGLLGVGLDVTPEHADYEAMRDEFLGIYADNLCRESKLFPGMGELLEALEIRGVKWGVVTNKAERYTHPLLKQLGVHHRAACIIGGDTTGKTKPDPAPLFAACERISIAPSRCIYVGDDRRDVQAGRAAGMMTIVAKFGYLHGNDPETWAADAMIDAPGDVLHYL
ncbi:MAG: phosphoglycolate phosphatase [Betaproteobacteria bacterium]|nr:phosphoglycolate phosphatase [Betaproteobacteria bacterium]